MSYFLGNDGMTCDPDDIIEPNAICCSGVLWEFLAACMFAVEGLPTIQEQRYAVEIKPFQKVLLDVVTEKLIIQRHIYAVSILKSHRKLADVQAVVA